MASTASLVNLISKSLTTISTDDCISSPDGSSDNRSPGNNIDPKKLNHFKWVTQFVSNPRFVNSWDIFLSSRDRYISSQQHVAKLILARPLNEGEKAALRKFTSVEFSITRGIVAIGGLMGGLMGLGVDLRLAYARPPSRRLFPLECLHAMTRNKQEGLRYRHLRYGFVGVSTGLLLAAGTRPGNLAHLIAHILMEDDPSLHEMKEKVVKRVLGSDDDKIWSAYRWSTRNMAYNTLNPMNWWHYYTRSHEEMEIERMKYFEEGLKLYAASNERSEEASTKERDAELSAATNRRCEEVLARLHRESREKRERD